LPGHAKQLSKGGINRARRIEMSGKAGIKIFTVVRGSFGVMAFDDVNWRLNCLKRSLTKITIKQQ
jgi:hypothetical protein